MIGQEIANKLIKDIIRYALIEDEKVNGYVHKLVDDKSAIPLISETTGQIVTDHNYYMLHTDDLFMVGKGCFEIAELFFCENLNKSDFQSQVENTMDNEKLNIEEKTEKMFEILEKFLSNESEEQ